MMSGHGANAIFSNKKDKIWTSSTLANHPPPTSGNISFLSYQSKWRSYEYHPIWKMQILKTPFKVQLPP